MLQNVKNNSSPQKHWYNCFMVWYGMVWYGMVWYGMVWGLYFLKNKLHNSHSTIILEYKAWKRKKHLR